MQHEDSLWGEVVAFLDILGCEIALSQAGLVLRRDLLSGKGTSWKKERPNSSHGGCGVLPASTQLSLTPCTGLSQHVGKWLQPHFTKAVQSLRNLPMAGPGTRAVAP